MSTFEMKQGDRKRALKYRVADYDETGKFASATVAFRMMDRNGTVTVDGTGAVLDDNGVLGYAWEAGETDNAGAYRAEFVVTFSDGLEDTYPSTGYIPVRINEEIPE